MILRFVRLYIEESKVEEFLASFDSSKDSIRAFEGCSHLELWKDIHSNSFTTYSHWDSEDSLNQYRASKLFQGIWKKNKTFFNDKPLAWSYERIHQI